jgi:hypothetical protein
VGGGLGLLYHSTALVTGGDTLPVRDRPDPVITEWQLDAQLTYLTIELNTRYRLFGMLSGGLGLRGHLLTSTKATATERIVSPADFYFQGGTKERTSSSSPVENAATFVLEPAVTIQWDFLLARGLLLSPNIQVSKPLTSLSANQDWSYWQVSAGLRLSRGF